MNHQQLMSEIYMHGFGRDDAALFLDTHPDCDEAYCFFCDCLRKYETAVNELSHTDHALFQSDYSGKCSWKWLDGPWPWEGGFC